MAWCQHRTTAQGEESQVVVRGLMCDARSAIWHQHQHQHENLGPWLLSWCGTIRRIKKRQVEKEDWRNVPRLEGRRGHPNGVGVTGQRAHYVRSIKSDRPWQTRDCDECRRYCTVLLTKTTFSHPRPAAGTQGVGRTGRPSTDYQE